MEKVQKSVRKFMELAKQPVLEKPGIPDEATRLLGMKLVAEEAFFELAEALGLAIVVDSKDYVSQQLTRVENIRLEPTHEADLTEIADALADGAYVLLWLANACGIDMEPVMEEICRSNLTKFQEGHSFSPEGKLLKSPKFSPPDIAAILEAQSKPLEATIYLDDTDNLSRFYGIRVPLVVFWSHIGYSQFDELKEMWPFLTQEHLNAVVRWVHSDFQRAMLEHERHFGRNPTNYPHSGA